MPQKVFCLVLIHRSGIELGADTLLGEAPGFRFLFRGHRLLALLQTESGLDLTIFLQTHADYDS